MDNRPVALDTMKFVIWGTGNLGWGDPRTVVNRQFSRHIVWLCRSEPRNAAQLADELNVPTVYVEEKLDILTKGGNGNMAFCSSFSMGNMP